MSIKYTVRCWGKETHSEECDINNIYWMADWARKFTTYRSDVDVNDPLKRGTIGVYQFYDYDVHLNMKYKYYQKREVEESLGSLILHITAALEMCDIDVAGTIANNYNVATLNGLSEAVRAFRRPLKVCYRGVARCSAGMLRQLLYYVMQRTNRYSEEKLKHNGVEFMVYAICLAQERNVDVARGMQTAIGKLIDMEFAKH